MPALAALYSPRPAAPRSAATATMLMMRPQPAPGIRGRGSGRSGTHTVAPARARTRAIPRPLPWAAPVTSATLPSSRPIERAGLLEPAVEGPRPPLVGEDRVLDRLAHAALHVGARAHPLHQLERLVAVLLLGVGVHLEVLHAHAVVPLEALVERLRVAAHARHPLARVAEGGEPLLVGAAYVVQHGVDGADRLRHGHVGAQLLVRDAERPRVLDLHEDVVRVAEVPAFVGEVLRPVGVVLGVLERERVGVGGVGDEQRELGRHPEPQVVELLRVALDDLQARPALADRGDHLALRVRLVLGDEAVEAGEELAHGERPLLAAALDDVLEGARRGHRYSSLALISIPRSRSSVFLAHARPF